MVRFPKLCKAIEYLVDRWGPIVGRTRLLKLVYLADQEWAKSHQGKPYTEAEYYRWNHGPFSREYLKALEWMDGVEIVETGHDETDGYEYQSGLTTRLNDHGLDPEYQTYLDAVGQQWVGKPLRKLLDYVYNDDAFKTKGFGENLL